MRRYLGVLLIFAGVLSAQAQPAKDILIAVFPFTNQADDRTADWIGSAISYNVTEGLAAVGNTRSVACDAVLSAYADYPFDVKKALDQNQITGNLVDANKALKASHTLLGSYRHTKTGDLFITCKLLNNSTKATKVLVDTVRHQSMADFSGICSFLALWAIEASGGTFTEKDRNAVLISTAVDARFDEFAGLWFGDQAYANGLRLMEEDRVDEAILQFRNAVRLDGKQAIYKLDLVAALMARGAERFKNNKLESAEEDYQSVAAIDPTNAKVFYNLGNLERKKGNLAKALEYYQKSTSLDSTFFKSFANLGMVFQQQGYAKKAISTYKKALTLNDQNADVHFNLGVIYDGVDSISLAIHHYEKAVILDKKNADAHLNLGILYKSSGQPKKAEIEYLSAITYKALNPVAHRNLGILYSRDSGKWDRAVKHFEKSLELDPKQDDAEIIKSNIAIMKKALSQ